MLQGISDKNWRLIDKIVMEVHDVDNRLQNTIDILELHRFKIVRTQKQESCTIGQYSIFIPDELRLYYIYAENDA